MRLTCCTRKISLGHSGFAPGPRSALRNAGRRTDPSCSSFLFRQFSYLLLQHHEIHQHPGLVALASAFLFGYGVGQTVGPESEKGRSIASTLQAI